MYHSLPSREFLDLSYRDDVCFIINRILRPLEPNEMREAYGRMLDAANDYGCQHWLIDLRRDTSYQPELLTTFFPQPGDSAKSITYLAYLVSPTFLAAMEEGNAIPLPSHYENLPFRAQLFIDEQAAHDWLTQH